MNLSFTLQTKLDAPLKTFEVALRSYVADKLLEKYPQKELLKQELSSRIHKIEESKVILSAKLSVGANDLVKNCNSIWENLEFSRKCYLDKEQSEEHDVLFVSQILLIIYLFRELYEPMLQSFESPVDFMSMSEKYHHTRNNLSHRASGFISVDVALLCVEFITKCCSVFEDRYFWYCSKDDVLKELEMFHTSLTDTMPKIANFDNIPELSNSIVCREKEINQLFKSVCGWSNNKRIRNTKHLVCVSGYGGIGKTSLVIEFLNRLLNKMEDPSYDAFRPQEFILFYSAKQDCLDYDSRTGDLQLKKTKNQFSSYDQLVSRIYSDLSIDSGFNDEWDKNGIFIFDNLETLDIVNRGKIIDFIVEEIPSSIHVIVTTRIPEPADEEIELRGFQNEDGIHFINEFLSENKMSLSLVDEKKEGLIRYSYGNSLVLVLALKRLEEHLISYHEVISELQGLPKNNTENIATSFMFQNTINELLDVDTQRSSLIKSTLICLSISSQELSPDILVSAHQKENVTIVEIEDILKTLTKYLIVEKIGDNYIINEFANRFIITGFTLSTEERATWETRILTAVRETRKTKQTVNDFKERYPELSTILQEWCGKSEEESLAICWAFAEYDEKPKIEAGNADYELSELNRRFQALEYHYMPHPYVYYQHSRILIELHRDRVIDNSYFPEIEQNYNRCLMLLNQSPFTEIKHTKTYPSILWIYSMYLLDANKFEEASSYANNAVLNFRELNITSQDSIDALVVYAIAEAKLFSLSSDRIHLKNAREVLKSIDEKKKFKKNVQGHINQLKEELGKYARISI